MPVFNTPPPSSQPPSLRIPLRTPFRTPWRAVTAMFMLNGALFGIWASRIPAVADKHDLTPTSLGVLLLCMAAGAIVSFPIAGHAADKYGSFKVTKIIAVAYCLALILIAFAPTTLTTAIALFIFGMFHGSMDVSMNTWAAEVERKSGRAMLSSFHAMFSLGAGVGAASGYFAVNLNLDINAHFTGAALIVMVLALFMVAIHWPQSPTHTSGKIPLFIVPKGTLAVVGMIAFCASLGEGAMADWSAIFLTTVSKASEAQAALGYTVFSIAMVAARLGGDIVVRRFGPVRTAQLSGAAAAIGVLCAIVFGTFTMSIIGFTLIGIGYAVIMPLAFSRAANDGGLSPGRALASVSTLGYGGLLLGPPVIGFIAGATSLQTAFLVLLVLAVLITVLSGALRTTLSSALRTTKTKTATDQVDI